MFEAELVNDFEELVFESEDFKLYRIVKENHGWDKVGKQYVDRLKVIKETMSVGKV